MTAGDKATLKNQRADNAHVRRAEAEPGVHLRFLFTASLAVAMVTSLWGPIAPGALASQLDDLGTDDPTDVEGVEEPPWRAWETTTIDRISYRTDIAIGPDDRSYITWSHSGAAKLAYPTENPLPGQQFATTAVSVNDRAGDGGVAVQDDGTVWTVYSADGNGDLSLEVYAATTSDPADEDWTRYRLADGAGSPRVAIAETGAVHVVYQDGATTLHHATYTQAEGWTQEAIHDVQPSGTRGIDIAIADERLHVVWTESVFDNPNPDKGYAVTDIGTDTDWTIEALPDPDDNCLSDPDVGASPDGSGWVVCRGYGGITAWQRTPEGIWARETVTDGSDLIPQRRSEGLGAWTSIAVDDSGIPHIAFHTDSPPFFNNDPFRPGQPQYAVRIDGDWSIETIDRDGQVNGRYISIALDSDDRPQVAYKQWARLDPSPGHPCPGCRELNERLMLRHAQPVATTASGALS